MMIWQKNLQRTFAFAEFESDWKKSWNQARTSFLLESGYKEGSFNDLTQFFLRVLFLEEPVLKIWSSLDHDLMASIWENPISILAGSLNSGCRYLSYYSCTYFNKDLKKREIWTFQIFWESCLRSVASGLGHPRGPRNYFDENGSEKFKQGLVFKKIFLFPIFAVF